MAEEPYEPTVISDDIYILKNLSTDNISACIFNGINSLSALSNLIGDKNCYRHSFGFTVFLCVTNLFILLCGIFGNSVVIHVVIWKIKQKTASSLFILNLAIADLLVILFCIPATLVANIFTPWIFGEIVCKLVAYAQGVAVFCSVYSLVAISVDRLRALHQNVGLTPNISIFQAGLIIALIWIVGFAFTLPWTFVFKIIYLIPDASEGLNHNYLPFCLETWGTKFDEIVFFIVIHVFACFILPFGLITLCNIMIWRDVLGVYQNSAESSSTSRRTIYLTEMQRNRKIRVLKFFTFLTIAFFICWLPLYLIIARVKFFYDESFSGYLWEQKLVSILIPISQLLGSCNSCVNPVFYALLNQTFRESFISVFRPRMFCSAVSPTMSMVSRKDNSMVAIVVPVPEVEDTRL